jgi:hypothetical protein
VLVIGRRHARSLRGGVIQQVKSNSGGSFVRQNRITVIVLHNQNKRRLRLHLDMPALV